MALAIAIFALMLAIAEIFGQKAQTESLQTNIEASNLWAFYQAKTIRRTIWETAADQMEAMLPGVVDAAQKQAMQERIARFRATAGRMESELQTNDGTQELQHRAREAERERDRSTRKHFRFELSKGSLQIAIVLASATVITGIGALLWAAGGLGVPGVLFMLGGWIV